MNNKLSEDKHICQRIYNAMQKGQEALAVSIYQSAVNEAKKQEREEIGQWALENVFTLNIDPDSMGVIGYDDLLEALAQKET